MLTLGGAVAGGVLLEWASLRGAFDNARREVYGNVDGYQKSLASLNADAALQAGSILHIGHATHLVTVAGVRVLTDPWLFDPAMGMLRHEKGLGPSPWDLAIAEVVFVSHEHSDHADPTMLVRLPPTMRVLVGSERTLEIAKANHLTNVTLLQPWQTVRVRDAEITAVPAPHDVPELGFVVKGAGKSVYYAGDAAEGPALDDIRTRLAPRTAILPVDGLHRKGQPRMTMGPGEAVEAARTLGVVQVMPSHAETRIADPIARAFLWEKTDDAANVFFALTKEKLPGVTCLMPAPGEIVAL